MFISKRKVAEHIDFRIKLRLEWYLQSEGFNEGHQRAEGAIRALLELKDYLDLPITAENRMALHIISYHQPEPEEEDPVA